MKYQLSLEIERAKYLKKAMITRGIVPDDFLEQGYNAILIHSNSTIFACNQALADMTGYTMEELEGMNAWRLIAPESADLLMQNLKTMSEVPYQITALRQDGIKYAVELKGVNFELSGDMARAVLIKAL